MKHLVKAMTPALVAVYTGPTERGTIPLEEKQINCFIFCAMIDDRNVIYFWKP